VTSVHDADTISATIHLPFGVDLPDRPLRAFGYDAWEVSRIRQTIYVSDDEIKKGLKARNEFNDLLKTGKLFVEETNQRDPYGRLHVKFWIQTAVEWIYVPKWMEDHGHCRK
jgi:endonuclease YncB( thermonuclease family)